jgi:hypothetical protein
MFDIKDTSSNAFRALIASSIRQSDFCRILVSLGMPWMFVSLINEFISHSDREVSFQSIRFR